MNILGVLGGMGPLASAEFMYRLVQQTPAKKDQDHIPTILWSDPRVPDRSTAMRRGTDEPLAWLQRGVLGLKEAGCTHIVIPCNTAHFWYHELIKLDVPILHIVDSVAYALKDVNVNNGTIGVMGTQATVELGLYQYRLNKLGWNCITPTKEQMDTIVQPCIDMIKANQFDGVQDKILAVAKTLIDNGTKAIVLGCTELPLSVKQEYLGNIPIINSIDSLVKLSIKTCVN